MPQRSFKKVFEDNEKKTIDRVSEVLRPKAKNISEEFYTQLLQSEDARAYLGNEMVETHLSSSFARWAHDLFCPKQDIDYEVMANYHLMIGRIHARIGIPMQLVDYGMQVVKDYCFRTYLDEKDDYEEVPNAIIFINNLLDTALTTINKSYFDATLDNERNAQLLRLKMTSSDLNVECERVKSDLLIWSRDILSHLLSRNKNSFQAIASIYNTNFGLWINHKAIFYFSDFEELAMLKDALFKLETICLAGHEVFDQELTERFIEFATDLNAQVNEVAWLLSQIIDRNIKESQSKDPLTNMLSRRYIDSVLKREVEISLKQNQKFAI